MPFWREDPEQLHVSYLARTYHAGAWSLVLVPPYPHGYVKIALHEPWDTAVLLYALAFLCAVATIRAVIRLVAPHAGRALGRRLHGDAWLVSGHGATVDWRRFADVVHFTLEHLALTGFVLVELAPEVADWVRAPRLWWEFSQPPLSSRLLVYQCLQIAVNLESALTMVVGLARGRAKDLPMAIHHATTLFILLFAHRMHFVRVGAAVVMLHDATDLPIDFLRLAQALDFFPAVAASAGGAIVTWATLRGYAFPRFIIWSALTQTAHMWDVHSYAPQSIIAVGYVLLIAPLVVINLLSMHWLRMLATKVRQILAKDVSRAHLDAGSAAVLLVVALAAAAFERLAASERGDS